MILSDNQQPVHILWYTPPRRKDRGTS